MSDVFPDRSMEHRDKIAWMVETNGWAIEAIPPHPESDPPTPGYAYTVGLEAAFAFPEVVVFGLTPVAARGLLGLVVDLLRDGVEIPVGAVFVGLLDGEQRSALLPVDLGMWSGWFDTAERSAMVSEMPADGPSFGIAPSGRWIWISFFVKKFGGSLNFFSFERK
jgi:hypothetical protein